jgi:short-subunit dehydrogenase
VIAADLTAPEAPSRIAAVVEERHGRLDVLVNNAGAGWGGRFAEAGWANVAQTMDLNFNAQVRLTEALLPLLRRSAPSSIVNVSSTAGRVARAGVGAYSASKFALCGWTDALRQEERSHRVHVGLVLPGWVPTEGFPAEDHAPASHLALVHRQRPGCGRGDRRLRRAQEGGALLAPLLRAGGRGARSVAPGLVRAALDRSS